MGLCRLDAVDGGWETGHEYQQRCPDLPADRFMQVTDVLLEKPNLNSTHLFRADILHDSASRLRTAGEKERQCEYARVVEDGHNEQREHGATPDHPLPGHTVALAPEMQNAALERSVLRRLIPRKPQLDRALLQWCYIYRLACGTGTATTSGFIVVYVPDVPCEADMPWYHPPVKALAYLYEDKADGVTLSVHFLPFTSPAGPLSSRLHRTMVSLLQTFLRLSKIPAPEHGPNGDSHAHAGRGGPWSSDHLPMTPSALKDTILPQHIVQDTYSRLKQQYAPDLISRWVEKTEPSKHVFEDLSIAAFVIELWKHMYGTKEAFPGFVDIACGNGVLSYVLIKEGYRGRGFDARRRKTWDVLDMDDALDEMICVPQPFLLDHHQSEETAIDALPDPRIHNGIFPPGTFIISNHADELTPWTPLLATLSSPTCPLPFLAIPCCSHALSGAKHRYLPKDILSTSTNAANTTNASTNTTEEAAKEEPDPQPAKGDLLALRRAKAQASSHADDKSTYACLTRKVVSLAEESGSDIELTLMRIPSTRNIGVVGNRKTRMMTKRSTTATPSPTVAGLQSPSPRSWSGVEDGLEALSVRTSDDEKNRITTEVHVLVDRECAMSGGRREAAKTWIERARKLQVGGGRGKVNLGGERGQSGHA